MSSYASLSEVPASGLTEGGSIQVGSDTYLWYSNLTVVPLADLTDGQLLVINQTGYKWYSAISSTLNSLPDGELVIINRTVYRCYTQLSVVPPTGLTEGRLILINQVSYQWYSSASLVPTTGLTDGQNVIINQGFRKWYSEVSTVPTENLADGEIIVVKQWALKWYSNLANAQSNTTNGDTYLVQGAMYYVANDATLSFYLAAVDVPLTGLTHGQRVQIRNLECQWYVSFTVLPTTGFSNGQYVVINQIIHTWYSNYDTAAASASNGQYVILHNTPYVLANGADGSITWNRALFFAPNAPRVTATSPTSGLISRITRVILTGTNLGTAAADLASITYGPNTGEENLGKRSWISSTMIACTAERIFPVGVHRFVVTTNSGGKGPISSATFVALSSAPPPAVPIITETNPAYINSSVTQMTLSGINFGLAALNLLSVTYGATGGEYTSPSIAWINSGSASFTLDQTANPITSDMKVIITTTNGSSDPFTISYSSSVNYPAIVSYSSDNFVWDTVSQLGVTGMNLGATAEDLLAITLGPSGTEWSARWTWHSPTTLTLLPPQNCQYFPIGKNYVTITTTAMSYKSPLTFTSKLANTSLTQWVNTTSLYTLYNYSSLSNVPALPSGLEIKVREGSTLTKYIYYESLPPLSIYNQLSDNSYFIYNKTKFKVVKTEPTLPITENLYYNGTPYYPEIITVTENLSDGQQLYVQSTPYTRYGQVNSIPANIANNSRVLVGQKVYRTLQNLTNTLPNDLVDGDEILVQGVSHVYYSMASAVSPTLPNAQKVVINQTVYTHWRTLNDLPKNLTTQQEVLVGTTIYTYYTTIPVSISNGQSFLVLGVLYTNYTNVSSVAGTHQPGENILIGRVVYKYFGSIGQIENVASGQWLVVQNQVYRAWGQLAQVPRTTNDGTRVVIQGQVYYVYSSPGNVSRSLPDGQKILVRLQEAISYSNLEVLPSLPNATRVVISGVLYLVYSSVSDIPGSVSVSQKVIVDKNVYSKINGVWTSETVVSEGQSVLNVNDVAYKVVASINAISSANIDDNQKVVVNETSFTVVSKPARLSGVLEPGEKLIIKDSQFTVDSSGVIKPVTTGYIKEIVVDIEAQKATIVTPSISSVVTNKIWNYLDNGDRIRIDSGSTGATGATGTAINVLTLVSGTTELTATVETGGFKAKNLETTNTMYLGGVVKTNDSPMEFRIDTIDKTTNNVKPNTGMEIEITLDSRFNGYPSVPIYVYNDQLGTYSTTPVLATRVSGLTYRFISP